MIPSQAVQTGQSGQYVFVIKPDMTADMRPIAIGATLDGETAIVIRSPGGREGCTDVQLRFVPGFQVAIRETPEQMAK